MSSIFETRMTAGGDQFFNKLGVAGAYTSPAGVTTSGLTVIVERGAAAVLVSDGQLVESDQEPAVVKVRAGELAAPERRGRFTVGADTWTVIRPPVLRPGDVWALTCEHVERKRRNEPRES